MKTKVCLNDFIAATAVLILAFALFLVPLFRRASADVVKVTTDSGERLLLLSDGGEFSFHSNGHTVVVKIDNGAASVLSSTCSDKICVNSEAISHSGDIIICAPALVSIEIEGEKAEVDYAVG